MPVPLTSTSSTPQLPDAAALPALAFERRLVDQFATIEHWFRQQWLKHTPPFYGSVDLRNAGFKLAPVDMNLFPGGFNNLAENMLPCAVQAAQMAVERACPRAMKLLLLPEQHTRNTFYLANVARLLHILRATGLEVRVGSWSEEVKQPTPLALPNQESILVEPLVQRGRRIGLADFDPDVVLLNNDLSAGIPEMLRHVQEQVLLPPLHAGWAVRRKSHHFAAYDEVAEDFARMAGIDPWLVNPYFARCGSVNFHAREGEECLATNVDVLLTRLRSKYKELGIEQAPFVIVKADAGTYGMGIMTVRDASEITDLNRKQRNKMAVVKEGLEVSEVIIQEGVPTLETVNQGVAEPVVYMMDRHVVGGFYRVHTQRGRDENLNAPGMHFAPLAFSQPCHVPCEMLLCTKAEEAVLDTARDKTADAAAQRYYTYGVVARLALLAAAIELERTAGSVNSAAPTASASNTQG